MTPGAPAAGAAAPSWPARLAAYGALAKPRLVLLVAFSALIGFRLAGGEGWLPALAVALGMILVAGGGAAFNQWVESAADARMERTRERPLPRRRVAPGAAFALGVALAALGLAILAAATNGRAAALSALGLALYAGPYTRLKGVTRWHFVAGAATGALPPVAGWAASGRELAAPAAALFGLLFAWQAVHVGALAWLHREDYQRAGWHALSRGDATGRRTASLVLAGSLALVAISLVPALAGWTGRLYGPAAAALGAPLLFSAALLWRGRDACSARRVFVLTLFYLPLLLGAWLGDAQP